VRWPLVFATVGILAFPPYLGAQPRRSVGGTSRPMTADPGLRSPAPSIRGRLPAPTIGIVAPFRGTHVHGSTPFRSSVLGLVFVDWYWWLYPDVGDEIAARPLAGLSGGLQLDVEPRRAFVYVDRVLAGTVDQFKGYYQHLQIGAGFHVIDFLAPDYEPLTVGVTVVPNQTTTFRAFLTRATGR